MDLSEALLYVFRVGPTWLGLKLDQHEWPRKKMGKVRHGRANHEEKWR